MKKVVLGLSGGMDSATLLGILLDMDYECHCVSFLYGSKHSAFEFKAAMDIVAFYANQGMQIKHHVIDLISAFNHISSNLLKDGGEIPEGHYQDESMKLTVVPGRNMIFASIMAGIAESVGAEVIALGVHAGDHAIYPDCRKEFVMALNSAIYLSSDRKVEVITPLQNMDKTGILQIGLNMYPKVPYELTRTCYKDQKYSCGKCGSCIERLEAFKNIGLHDPIDYEEDDDE